MKEVHPRIKRISANRKSQGRGGSPSGPKLQARMRRPADRNILAQRRKGAEERISETFGILPRYTGVLLEICEHVGLIPRVSPERRRPSWRKPLTEPQRRRRKVLARNATSSSASSPLCEDSAVTPRNPMPQNTVPILAFAGFKSAPSAMIYQVTRATT